MEWAGVWPGCALVAAYALGPSAAIFCTSARDSYEWGDVVTSAGSFHQRQQIDEPHDEREEQMSPTSFQTIRLSRGRHKSPDEGACVMELASMLAGEPFSDHPASVCPVIAAFLRAYNDSVDDERRQHLYPYAAKVVGSRGSREVERLRTERLTAVSDDTPRRRGSWFPLSRVTRAVVMLRTLSPDEVGARAVHSISKHTNDPDVAVLALVDELLEIGATDGEVIGAAASRSLQLVPSGRSERP